MTEETRGVTDKQGRQALENTKCETTNASSMCAAMSSDRPITRKSDSTSTVPVTELPDSVRIPLHSLQADLEYLIGRVIADNSCGPMIVKSMSERLDQIETFLSPQPLALDPATVEKTCEDCPPCNYPTDETRCAVLPSSRPHLGESEMSEPFRTIADRIVKTEQDKCHGSSNGCIRNIREGDCGQACGSLVDAIAHALEDVAENDALDELYATPAPQQLVARIKRSSKYAYQAPKGGWFDVLVVPDMGYGLRGNNNNYRFRDVVLGVLLDDGVIVEFTKGTLK